MSAETVGRADMEEDLCWIRLDKPAVSNAADTASMRQLCVALDKAIADPAVRAIALAER